MYGGVYTSEWTFGVKTVNDGYTVPVRPVEKFVVDILHPL